LTRHQLITHILQTANDVVGGSDIFWLADTTDYDKAPQKRVDGFIADGTSAPIHSLYTSPLVGWKIEDVADWMRKKPSNVSLDAHHFAILDVTARDEKRIVMCRIGGEHLKDMSDLDWMRDEAEEAAKFLYAMTAYNWEEKRDGNPGLENGLGGKPDIKY
jgi:hypothetical protein